MKLYGVIVGVLVLAAACADTPATSQLVNTVPEPPGANCAAGGVAIETGLDANHDGTLEASEVTSTSYVCTPTATASDLVKLVPEPAGANCANGGQAIETGVDTNSNGMLDDSEVTAISYVCAGTGGVQPLIRLDPEPPGANCGNGGTAIHVGTDTNGDGMLENAEITETTYVCSNEQPLVRVDSEPPGANCTSGGSAIRAGLDTNGDGILENSEIQTTSYLCATTATPTTIVGTFTVQSSLDVATLDGVQTVAGDLVIDTQGMPQVDIPTVQTIGGVLRMSENNSTTTEVSLANLTNVGEFSFPLDTALTTISLPKLQSITGTVGMSDIEGCNALTSIDLSMLGTVRSRIEIEQNNALTTVALPSLVTGGEVFILNNPSLTSLNLSALTTAGSIYVSGTQISTLSLPALTSSSGTVLVSSNSQLTSLGLGALHSGAVDIDSNPLLPSAALGALTTGAVGVYNNALLTSLNVSAFQSGAVNVNADAKLASLSLPALTTATSLTVSNLPKLTTLSIPVLQSITGDFEVYTDQLLTSLSAPALVSVGGLVEVSGWTTSFSAPSLQTVGADFDVSGNSKLNTVNVSALTTVMGVFALHDDAKLGSLSAPALQSASSVQVYSDALLTTFSAPMLTSCLQDFFVYSDPQLPLCQVQAVLIHISPVPMSVNTSGDQAVCM